MVWNVEKSKELYGIKQWGLPYFDVGPNGLVYVSTQDSEQKIHLIQIVEDLKSKGVTLPVLIRFPDILDARIKGLNNCFEKAIEDMSYTGSYKGVYPVKVNQERHLVEDVVRLGTSFSMGLECGSKPELLIALSKIANSPGLIICNGFKDDDYIETALLSRKLGRDTIIVIDRFSELNAVLKFSKIHDIRPSIGLRVKLTTQGTGRWAESSGNKSKFGLTPNEIVSALGILKSNDMLDTVDLVHFHIGSQVPSIQSIKSALKEGARFYSELFNQGAHPKYIDVGGGLGVNYDGSGSSDSSVNYSDQEYANDVVYTIKSICDEKSIPHPNIVTESGRSLVAHSSVLIFDVLGANEIQTEREVTPITAQDHQVLRDLADIAGYLDKKSVIEAYNDTKQIKRDVLQLFTYGVLSLKQRALAEEMINNTLIRIRKIARKHPKDFHDLVSELDALLCESYFCNFSIFQSLPDSWAMEQLFPVMPIHRLEESPDKRAILVDLTCDSDGALEHFVDPTSDEPQSYLEVHSLKKDEPYYLAAFLTGAYQEILGDLHNLFGDTNALHVTFCPNNTYKVEHYVEGESISEVLRQVSYKPEILLDNLKQDIEKSLSEDRINTEQANSLVEKFKTILEASTYLINS